MQIRSPSFPLRTVLLALTALALPAVAAPTVYEMRLMTHAEPRDGHVSIPVLRIHRDPRGGFEADPAFVPPCVAISAATPVSRTKAIKAPNT